MGDLFYSIDKSLFYFCNQTLANPVFDVTMPLLTDWNKTWWGLTIFGLAWLALIVKGGKKGRMIGLLLIPLIFLTDQVNSTVIKKIVARPRPCHEINGIPVLEHIRLLVPCGAGYSFPSSHAANSFGVATLLAFYYRRWSWAFFLFASVMAFSRVSVGVHYPSDVLAGGIVGGALAVGVITIYEAIGKKMTWLSVRDSPTDELKV